MRPAILPHRRSPSLDFMPQQHPSVNYANAMPFYHSPMKKKGGTLAGIPRASGERNSPVGNGASSGNQVRLFHICTILIHLCITAASICSLLAILFMMVLESRWGDGSKSLIPHAAVACKKCKRPGGNLCSAFRLYRADQPCHTTPPTSSIILPSMKLATLPSPFSPFRSSLSFDFANLKMKC
jgi:hypothetical protein